MDQVDLVVIGAGVVGLAIARAAALRGAQVMVLERHDAFGTETSARNSEVVHAGMYYPAGSLKAALCVEGRRRLYAYMDSRSVPYRTLGKLIVACSDADERALEQIETRAQANGLTGADALHRLSAAQAQSMEPALACQAALWSPETGILDSHALMTALLADAEGAGAMLVPNTDVTRFEPGTPHRLHGTSLGETFDLAATRVIIAAGLHTAGLCEAWGLPAPQAYWLKGSYFLLSGRGPFQRLIYPIPQDGGLGVHVTLDMGGGTRFGPDAQPVTTLDYTVTTDQRAGFETAIRRYWPTLPDNALVPGYAGIRPKLSGGDFVIHGPTETGHADLCVLHGIESPGLTSCLSLADAAVDRLGI